MPNLADGIGLLIGVVAVATLADRLRIAYPILLVIVGVGVALIPVHHQVELPPELFLLVFLPPLIYDASLETTTRELRAHLRPILFLAVGLVLATMVAVAVVMHTLDPALGWPVVFALGAIVSPPDSIAATQIAGKLGLPRRLVTILGGEGLMNDATALTAYQLAIAAIGTTLTIVAIVGRFAFAVVVGIGIGLAIGFVASRLLRFIETPVIENTLLLTLPFAAYLPADKAGASGVLAVMTAALYFGRFGSASLTPAARLQQREFWGLLVFLLSSLSFLLVGLELRPVLSSLAGRAPWSLAGKAATVVGVVVVVRLVWIFGAAALSRLRHRLGTERGLLPSWRATTVVSWAGMRGAVSLAAALALPKDFPDRNLLVFLTFAVIFATLVGQGLTLPPLIARLGLIDPGEKEALDVLRARRRITASALAHLDTVAEEDRYGEELVERLQSAYRQQLERIEHRLEVAEARSEEPGPDVTAAAGNHVAGSGDFAALEATERSLRSKVIEVERAELNELVAKRRVSLRAAEDVRTMLDLDETSLRP